MHARRAVAALSVLAILLTGLTPVAAQTDVEEAERRAEQAAAEAEAAYSIADAALSNQATVEAELFAALDRYNAAGLELAAASRDLERVSRSLAYADAQAETVEAQLEDQSVEAYMEAISGNAPLILDAPSAEGALVVRKMIDTTKTETLNTLDDLLFRTRQLADLRASVESERERVAATEERLAAEADQFESLLQTANAEVAQAFATVSAAESALSSARSEVADAEAAAAADEEDDAPATTTTTIPDGTTTTTSPPGTSPPPVDDPPADVSAAAAAWRPIVEQHFAPDLVEDALRIIDCESLGDPNAVNPYSQASGLFQFLPGTWAVASVEAGVGDRSVFDGEANTIAAAWLAEYYRSRGYDPWQPWACRFYL